MEHLTKKKYNKPILNKVRIDNQISLVMMTEPGPPGGPFSEQIVRDAYKTPYKS